jgi:hypothetical protein
MGVRARAAHCFNEMAKVARLTDGQNNWVFFADGETVKVTMTDSCGIDSRQEYDLERGREVYKLVRKFNPKAKEGFTPLQRALKSIRIYDKDQVNIIDNHDRKQMGDDAWAEHSCATWEDFHSNGFHEFYYTAGCLNRRLVEVGIKVI